MSKAWCLDEGRKVVEAEMYLGQDQFDAYFKGGVVEWYDPDDVKKFRCEGIDPTTFPKTKFRFEGYVPFKFKSENSAAALEGYVRAYRTQKVKGLPKYLIRVSMPSEDALRHFANGDISVYKNMKTLAFHKCVNTENYPAIDIKGALLPSDVITHAFNEMYSSLERSSCKRPREGDESESGGGSSGRQKTEECSQKTEEHAMADA